MYSVLMMDECDILREMAFSENIRAHMVTDSSLSELKAA